MMEHGRWVVERTKSGWRYAQVRDNDRKLRPSLISWEDLPEDEKQKDYDAVLQIPVYLKACGLKIVSCK